MQTQIQGVFSHMRGYELVKIFGYTSQGLPGIEIIGMGAAGRILKEKMIFLSRSRSMKFPLKRYVLGVEMDESAKTFGDDSLRWLEFPFLLCFWTLCGFLPITKLDDCIAAGKISVNGTIEELSFPKKIYFDAFATIGQLGYDSLKIISEFSIDDYDCKFVNMPASGILDDLYPFQFEQNSLSNLRSIGVILAETDQNIQT